MNSLAHRIAVQTVKHYPLTKTAKKVKLRLRKIAAQKGNLTVKFPAPYSVWIDWTPVSMNYHPRRVYK